MRRNIGYTGRKTLDRSVVEVELHKTEAGKHVTLTLADPAAFDTLPSSSRVKLRLFENQFSETVLFGSLGKVANGVERVELKNHDAFTAPSAQLRVVEASGVRRGLVLGSTKRWTLRMEGDDKKGNICDGLLGLEVSDISPRAWKVDVRDDEHPIVYIDSKIKKPEALAQSDEVFLSCVLPAVIREIFDDIYNSDQDSNQQWIEDWVEWADSLSEIKFSSLESYEEYREWVQDLIEEFCRQHDLLKMLVQRLEGDSGK